MANQDAHILILSSWYPTQDNPFLGNFIERQVALLAIKYRVSIIQCIENKAAKDVTIDISSIEKLQHIIASYPRKAGVFSRKKQQKKALETALDKLENVDLIIGNILLPNGWQFILAKKKLKCPLLYLEHGSYFRANSDFNWRWSDKWIKNKMEKEADEIMAVSEFLKVDLQSYFPSKEIKVIGNHVDTKLFEEKSATENLKHTFLHVSTLDKRTKNLKGILEACSILKSKEINFSMLIVSDEDYTTYASKVDELGMSELIKFQGPLDWHELPPLYKKSKAFVLFSEYESFSIVLAEAWSTGTPVISTSVGIAHELPAQLGIQVKQNNVESLANAMMEVASGKQFDSNLIHEHAEQFSAENILKKWTSIISKHVH